MRTSRIFFHVTLTVALLCCTSFALAGSARHMVPGERCYGRIGAQGENDVYLLDAPADALLTIIAKPWKGASLRCRIRLLAPDGTELPVGYNSKFPKRGAAHKVSKLRLPESGTYELIVHSEGSGTGGYDLKTKVKAPKKIVRSVRSDENGNARFDFWCLAGSKAKFKIVSGNGTPSVDGLVLPDSSTVHPDVKIKKNKAKIRPFIIPQTGACSLRFSSDAGVTVTFAVKAKIKAPRPPKVWWEEEDFQGRGSIAGSLVVDDPDTGVKRAGEAYRRPLRAERWVEGEILVKLAEGSIEELVSRHPDQDLRLLDGLPTLRTYRLRTRAHSYASKGRRARRRDTNRTVSALERDPRVEHVEWNRIANAAGRPNDPLYSSQWHYEAIHLEEAWDVTTGSPDIVVAVVDSGIIRHEDLNRNVLPSGYDFVGSTSNSGDGNAEDADPTAVGSYHGVHVAGTVGAVSNNGIGVCGASWRVGILPLRVIGTDGRGSHWDIARGILYAAGVADPAVPTNPTPAHIVNLSLGGSHSGLLEDAVERASAAGAVLVAAAGNEDTAAPSYPAGYPEVISVSAVNRGLRITSYSNYGTTIDLAAPGGELSWWDDTGGVLSTYRGENGEPYQSSQGTSMAAPHVSGVAALMLSANPSLTSAELQSILETTALDLGVPGKDTFYGHGLVDAAAAVREAKAIGPSGDPDIVVAPGSVVLGPGQREAWVAIRNDGGGSPSISSVDIHTDVGSGWLSATLEESGFPALVRVRTDSSGLPDATYRGRVVVTTTAGEVGVPVRMKVAPPPDIGAAVVYLLDSAGNTIATDSTDKADGLKFSFPEIPPGDYRLLAVTGFDDGQIDMNDWFGEWPLVGQQQSIRIGPEGTDVAGLSLPVHRVDTLVEIPGVGAGPINGALAVKVLDGRSGEPIEGATVYVGEADHTGTTDHRGRLLFEGIGSGPKTVTAVAPGYDCRTYVAMDAQYMNFNLAPTVGPSDFVEVSIRIRNLLWYETAGIVGVGDQWVTYTYDGWNDPIVKLDVPKGRSDIAVSTLVYDSLGDASSIGYTFIGPFGSDPAAPIDLYTWFPDDWWYTSPSGRVILPSGNFDPSSIVYAMMVYAYDSVDFPILLGMSFPSSSSNFYLEWAYLGDEIEATVPGFQVYAAVDGQGSMTFHYVRDWLADLPGGLVASLLDVPRLDSPADGQLVYTTAPQLGFSSPLYADLVVVELREKSTGRKWYLNLQPGPTVLKLPDVPLTPIRRGEDYEWKVTGLKIPDFDYDEFRWDHFDSATQDLSMTTTRSILVR